LELILVTFHFSQFGPGDVNERGLLLNDALQVYDNLPNVSGCPSSSAGSGIGQFHGFRGRVGLLAFHSCKSPGPDRGRWCKVFLTSISVPLRVVVVARGSGGYVIRLALAPARHTTQ
jgi:hypothetical protein